MRGSRAAAEVAALEGLMSSPDTQECKRIFKESLGCGFDSQQTIEDSTIITHRPQPQLSRPGVSLSVSNFVPIIPSAGVSSRCSQQGKPLANPQAPSNLQPQGPHPTAISGRDTLHTLPDFLHPREDSHSEVADVQTEVNSALDESFERIPSSRAHGIAADAGLPGGRMEDFISPLDGSDGSNLSPTQENDPAVYIRLQQELIPIATNSQNSSHGPASWKPGIATNTGSVLSAQDTGVTYAVNDTGHLTLDYHQPSSSPSLHDSFDRPEIGDILSARFRPEHINEDNLRPETPAQARLAIEHPGTVMRPSQMFAETQPSPGSRDRHLLPPSSSRPSPALFNQYQSPKHPTSSPLARRTRQNQLQVVENLAISSSPERPQTHEDSCQSTIIRLPLTECTGVLRNARGESPISSRLLLQNTPEPFNIYTTLQESQERRKQKEIPFDHDDKSSYDGFSDDEQEPTRRARRKKEKAAKELAVIGTTTPGAVEKDFVEVPSTSNCRRRSLAEEYEAQCSGFDARDTQPDATIMDSQSAPVEATHSLTERSTFTENRYEFTQSEPQTSQHQHISDEDLKLCEESCQDASSGQLPGLDHNGQSQATDSDREGSRSPDRAEILNDLAFSIAELRTPAIQKKPSHVDGDPVVPETSPSEPHLQRFGDIVVQTPPLLPAEEIDDGYNPFTQDTEFENLLQSPSPQRRTSSRVSQHISSITALDTRRTLGIDRNRKPVEILEAHLSQPTPERPESGLEMRSILKDTASEDASAYVTAPTGSNPESPQIPKLSSEFGLDNVRVGIELADNKLLPERGSQASRINLVDRNFSSCQFNIPTNTAQTFPAEIMQDSPLVPASPSEESKNILQRIGDHSIIGNTNEVLENNYQRPPPAKKVRPSRPSIKSSKQIKISTEKAKNPNSAASAVEVPAIIPNRLRSATQLRGSSRALRRLVEDSNVAPSTPAPSNTIHAAPISKLSHSSRRSSANSSEKAQSTEPDGNVTPSLSTRRRTVSNHAVEQGIFEGMAFSVTYNANREDEKLHVLEMIRKNGGRVLEKGFDELFDVNSFQRSSFAKHNESATVYTSGDLTLTAAARAIGFACVIADDHSRRVKFMQALALGLPCISGRWVKHCVARQEILGWEQYHLAAGESSFLGGAIRSRNLQPYPANTANFADRFEQRPRLLMGKSILVITGKGKVEERRKPYFFLTQALGARRVKLVQNSYEARKFLSEAEDNREEWNWVYVDENEDEAEKAIFGVQMAQPKKRKRVSEVSDDGANRAPPPRKVRIVSDEYVIQSLILGKFIEE